VSGPAWRGWRFRRQPGIGWQTRRPHARGKPSKAASDQDRRPPCRNLQILYCRLARRRGDLEEAGRILEDVLRKDNKNRAGRGSRSPASPAKRRRSGPAQPRCSKKRGRTKAIATRSNAGIGAGISLVL